METERVAGVELIKADDMVIHHQRRTSKPFESESVAFWVDQCREGSTALDIGAYTGLYTVKAATAGCSVVAFEPNEAVFKRLFDNVGLNGVKAELYGCAVGDRQGSVGMKTNKAVALTSGGRVLGGGDIPMISIDSLQLPDVCVIKIDTEGYETKVLLGMTDTIKRCKPAIITEALTADAAAEQAAILEPMGYASTPADEHNLCWSQSQRF